MIKRYLYHKVIAVFLAVQLALTGLCYCGTANNYGRLPAFKELSESYSFPVLKGVKYNRENPLKLEFIIDGGNAGKVSPEETQKLIRYFLAGLTCPKNDLWVNLSPYERDRIVPQALGETDLGYDMLKQDCLLKRLAASLTYPESESGKAYWNAINGVGANNHSPAANNFNKVWIVPGKAEIYENETTAFITDSDLKAMAEEDYLAMGKNGVGANNHSPAAQDAINRVSTSNNTVAFRQYILPLIEKEVNNGRSFANLRQFYSALILAVWFKEKFKNSLYLDFVDQNKITGIDLNDPQAKERVYNRYLAAFKDGVYDLVRKENVSFNHRVTRRYFSGGFDFVNLKPARSWTISRKTPAWMKATAIGLYLAMVNVAFASAAPAQDLPRTPSTLAGGKTAQVATPSAPKAMGTGAQFNQMLERDSLVRGIFRRLDYFDSENLAGNQFSIEALVNFYRNGSLSLEEFPPVFWQHLRNNLGGDNYYHYRAEPLAAVKVLAQFAHAANQRLGSQAKKDKDFLRDIITGSGILDKAKKNIILSDDTGSFVEAADIICALLENGLIGVGSIPSSTLGRLIKKLNGLMPDLSKAQAPESVKIVSPYLIADLVRYIDIIGRFSLTSGNDVWNDFGRVCANYLNSHNPELEDIGLRGLAVYLRLVTSGDKGLNTASLDIIVQRNYIDNLGFLSADQVKTLGVLIDKRVITFTRAQWKAKLRDFFVNNSSSLDMPFNELMRQGVVDIHSFPLGYFDRYLGMLAGSALELETPFFYVRLLEGLVEPGILSVNVIPDRVVDRLYELAQADNPDTASMALIAIDKLTKLNHPRVKAHEVSQKRFDDNLAESGISGVSGPMRYFYGRIWKQTGGDKEALRKADLLAKDYALTGLYFLCPTESQDAFFASIAASLQGGSPNAAQVTAKAIEAILDNAAWAKSKAVLRGIAPLMHHNKAAMELLPEAYRMSILFINNLAAGNVPPNILKAIYANQGFAEAAKTFGDMNMLTFDLARGIYSYAQRSGEILDNESIPRLAKNLASILWEERSQNILSEGGEVYALLHAEERFGDTDVKSAFSPYVKQFKYSSYQGAGRKAAALRDFSAIQYNPAGVVIAAYTHGGPKHIWVDNGLPGQENSDKLDELRAISYKELAQSLLPVAARCGGDLSFITIMLDNCFSGNYGMIFFNNLWRELKAMQRAGKIKKLPRGFFVNQVRLVTWGNTLFSSVASARRAFPPELTGLPVKAVYAAEQANFDERSNSFDGAERGSIDDRVDTGNDFLFALHLSEEQRAALGSDMGRAAKSRDMDVSLVGDIPLVTFMGHDAEVTEIESASDGNLQAKVKDLKTGVDGSLLLVPCDAASLTQDAQAVVSVSALDEPLRGHFNRLLEGSASGLYVYNAENVRDMFGFSFQGGAYDIKALHKKIVDQPGAQRGIAYFHESMHQWVNQEKIDIVFHDEPSGEVYLEVIDRSDKANPLVAGKVMLTNPDAVALATCDRAGQAKYKYHYLIRALQLQVFKADPALSDFIDGLSRQPVAAPDVVSTPNGGLDFSQDKFNLKVHSSVPDLPVSGGKGYDYLFIEDVQVKNISAERLQAFLQQP